MDAPKSRSGLRAHVEERVNGLGLDGEARERALANGDRLEELDDGTVIVKLTTPVRVGKGDAGERSRLAVSRVRWKDLRGLDDADPELHSRLADRLVEPAHAHDEIATEDDQVAVLLAVSYQLGKYRARATGPATSR